MATTTIRRLLIAGTAALCAVVVSCSPSTPGPSGDAGETPVVIPGELQRVFGQTDWSIANANLENAVNGGPGKDGIPSIDTPKFLPIATFDHPDSVQAILMNDGNDIKVYPYNILNWHEIVNDTVDGVPVAVTFCPLCGSAIVFDRRVDNETLTFGVSGFLLESNMIMFDRENEALWQQSTGRVLAGRDLSTELKLAPFQLMTVGEVKKMYPAALVLSEDTGHIRDYGRNPYAGYEDSEGYYFAPSREDAQYPSKMIFVVFRYAGEVIGVPFPELTDGIRFETSVKGDKIGLERFGQILTITDSRGEELPFYFEMWFSFANQHGGDAIVFDPAT
jgi:hypothetical protein